MNESHFESSLRALLPSAASAGLEERIEAELSGAEPAPAANERKPVSIRFEQAREPFLIRFFHNLGWAVAGAASAVAAIALFPAKPAAEKPETPRVPTSAVNAARPAGPESSVAPVSPISTAPIIPVSNTLPAGSGNAVDFQAAETTRELISSEEEGQVIYRTGTSPVRQVRNLYRERHSWTNPRTGARVDIEIPREDVFLKPVSLQ
jgi:hypothetical protein